MPEYHRYKNADLGRQYFQLFLTIMCLPQSRLRTLNHNNLNHVLYYSMSQVSVDNVHTLVSQNHDEGRYVLNG